MAGLFDRRGKNFKADVAEYGKGNITAEELRLRTAGNIGGGLGDLVAYPFEQAYKAIVPDEYQKDISNAIASGVKSISETEMAQEIIQYAKENPRAAKNIVGTVEAIGIIPAYKAFGPMINKLLRGTNTEMKGGILGTAKDYTQGLFGGENTGKGINFYGNPLLKPISFGGQVLNAVPDAIGDALIPSRSARVRALDIDTHRAKEIQRHLSEKKLGYAQGSANAGNIIHRQLSKDIPEQGSKGIEAGPLVTDEFIQKGLNYQTDKPTIQATIFGDDIPLDVQQRTMGDIEAALKVGKDTTEVAIKNPSAQGIAAEAAGVLKGTGGLPSKMLFAEKSAKEYLPVYNKAWGTNHTELTPEMYVEFMQVSNAMDKLDLQKIAKKFKKDTKGNYEYSGTATTRKILHARAREAAGLKLNKHDVTILKAHDKVMTRRTVTSGFTKRKSKLSTIKDSDGNVVSGATLNNIKQPKGKVFMGGSHHSATKELGGVHTTTAVDPYDHKMYITVSDGHDMFGLDPAGGHRAITIVPTQVVNFRKSKDSKQRFDGGRATGPKSSKTNIEEATKRIENMTGVKKLPNENALQHHARALREANITPTGQDYRDVLRRAATGGLLFTEVDDRALLDERGLFNGLQ